MRTRLLSTLWLMTLTMVTACTPTTDPDADTAKPNVILFLVDDMGWSDLGVYGSEFYDTPNIDALASGGVRFTSAYAAGHVCSPTRASLMTGKYPARLQLTDWLPGRAAHDHEAVVAAPRAKGLALDETTIAEVFREHGYRTGIFGKWHLGGDDYGPTLQGFDIQVPQWNGCCPMGGYHPPYVMEGLAIPGREAEYVTDRLTELAVDFIGEASDQPYFLYMSHFSVHDPIQGRADLVDKYREKLAAQPERSGSPFILEANPDEPEPLSREELDALIDTPAYSGHYGLSNRAVKIKQHQDNIEFAAMVESIDESIGRILAALEANGDTKNTIIVFYSDNGGMSAANAGYGSPTTMDVEALVAGAQQMANKRAASAGKTAGKTGGKTGGNTGGKTGKIGLKGGQLDNLDLAYATSNLPLRGAKGWLYEGGIRVPLIVHWPVKGAQGLVSDVPVTSADFYPTLLEMAGLPLQPAQHVDGVSFAPVVEGSVTGEQDADLAMRPIFWHFPHYSNHGGQSPGGAVRSGPYKLLEYYENGSTQLFNLDEDIGEQVNLVASEPEIAASLLAELHAWRERVDATMPGRRDQQ